MTQLKPVKLKPGSETSEAKPHTNVGKPAGSVVAKADEEEKDMNKGKKGLWDNIHAKRKRGEKPAKPGDGDYPKESDLEDSQKSQSGESERIKNLLKKHGLKGVNQPKMTPDHPTKKGIVLAKEGGTVKLIRFGAKGYGHNYSSGARSSFKARHGKNIKSGKLSAAYWADKVLWSGEGGKKKSPPKDQSMKKSLDRANELIKAVKESLSEEDMDLKKKFKSKKQQKYMHAAAERGDVPKKVVEEFSDKTSEEDYKKMPEKVRKGIEELAKALKAGAIVGLGRRARMDAAYQAGLVAGRQHQIEVEPADLTGKLNVGITEEQTRPAHEPPVVPVRRVDTPNPIPTKKCGDHEYKAQDAGPQEAKEFWRR